MSDESARRVVSLTGEPVRGFACADIVHELEELLSQAKRGEIDGLAFALSRPNDTISTRVLYGSAGFRLLAAVGILHHDMFSCAVKKMDGDDISGDAA